VACYSEVATGAHNAWCYPAAQAGYAILWIMVKKQTGVALVLLLLVPIVWRLGGLLFGLINPETAAGHADYVRNYRFLHLVKMGSLWASAAVVAFLWLLVCYLVIRSKERSAWWLFLAALGPIGFAILAGLNDRAPAETDRYARFVRNLNGFARFGYELCIFVLIWLLAYQGMVLKRNVMIMHQSAVTGLSTAQVIDLQNASSGMWAFAEGNEEMYMVVLLYLIWPVVFNIMGRVMAVAASNDKR